MQQAPAYYATGRTGFHAWWTLLHPPYTLMHLSFVVAGAALAPTLDWARLGLTLLAFFLAMGIAAHALDELKGRPLQTAIGTPVLVSLAVAALLAAAALGVWGALHYALVPGMILVALGVFLVVAYNLELWDGKVHTDLGFAAAWGAFPVLVAYYAQTGTLTLVAFVGAAYGLTASLVQRHLSTPARDLRRRAEEIEGSIAYADGRRRTIDRDFLLQTPERALKALVVMSVLVAVALAARHVPQNLV